MCSPVRLFCQVAATCFEYTQSSENAFAERFKYDVISSSLLSSAIAATPTTRRTFGSDVPGKLDDSSDEGSSDEDNSQIATSSPLSEFQVPIALVAAAAIALAAEYYFVAIFLMLAATYSWHSVKAGAERATTTASVRPASAFILLVRSLLRADSGGSQPAYPSGQCLGLRCARSHLHHREGRTEASAIATTHYCGSSLSQYFLWAHKSTFPVLWPASDAAVFPAYDPKSV